MPSDQELVGLDPVDLMDQEAARIETYLSTLPPAEWGRPSRCEGWTVRDLVAHLAASERYFHACLDGEVSALMEEMGARGATDVAGFNALGIADIGDTPNDELVQQWSAANAHTRHGFRERGDGEVDTSVGAYPARWQAFHLAGELAIHADDISIPVPEGDLAERLDWRVRFSRFALEETKPDLTVEKVGTRTRVVGDGLDLELDDPDLVEVVAGRTPKSPLDAAARTALSTMP